MKRLAQIISMLALLGLLAIAGLYFTNHLRFDTAKTWLLVATVAWFVATPFWMEHKLRA